MSDWKAGDKALCVNDDGLFREPFNGDIVVKGITYLVEGVDPFPHQDAGLFISGVEAYWHNTRTSFTASRFRKVVSRSERQTQYKEATNILLSSNVQPRVGFKP